METWGGEMKLRLKSATLFKGQELSSPMKMERAYVFEILVSDRDDVPAVRIPLAPPVEF
jgi:hypothetical protein